jgi:hypothetical protein
VNRKERLSLLERLIFPLHEGIPDGLESWQTAYKEIKDDEYKAEQDLAEKYRSFVSEIMRLSLAGIGVFPFLITRIESHISTQIWCLASLGIILLGISIFFAMRFLFGASEGLRWYIAGLRYSKFDNVNAGQTALKNRGIIITKCRHDKFWAAGNLLFGAVFMAFAAILAMSD